MSDIIDFSINNIIDMGDDLFIKVTGKGTKFSFPGIVINGSKGYVKGAISVGWDKKSALHWTFSETHVDNYSII